MIISKGILFALCSLMSAGLNEVVFKKYSSQIRSRGMLICGVGIVWVCLQIIYLHYSNQSLNFNATSITYGLTAGFVVTLSNILLLVGLTHTNVSLGSTIYRMNTIGVVALSIIFLGESLGLNQSIGIALGVVAILLLYRQPQSQSRSVQFQSASAPINPWTYVWVLIIAALLRALYSIFSKAGLEGGGDLNTMIFISAFCWIVGGLLFAGFYEKRLKISTAKIKYACISGVLVFMIVNFLLLALSYANASVVVPIANMSFVVALMLSIILGLERISWIKVFAVVLACISIYQLSL